MKYPLIWSPKVTSEWQGALFCGHHSSICLQSTGYQISPPLCLEATVLEEGRKGQPIAKGIIKKLTQETSLHWKEALPITLLCIASKEALDGWPFLTPDFFIDPQTPGIQTHLYKLQLALKEYSLTVPTTKQEAPLLHEPGDQVLIKVWKDGSLAAVVLQNKHALDLLSVAQGGTCLFLQEECCFYVNKSLEVQQDNL